MRSTPELLCEMRRRVRESNPQRRLGALESVVGSLLVGRIPGARLGGRVQVGSGDGEYGGYGEGTEAEIVGFHGERVMLQPLSSGGAWSPGMELRACPGRPGIAFGPGLLGCILDAAGRRLDHGPLPPGAYRPLDARPPDPLTRAPIRQVLHTGVRAIDGLCTLGRGQRVGLFAGPGVGKSTLLGQLAANADCDCTVICLVGERGREVNDFLRGSLGPGGLQRAVVVCATSDAPAALRARALPLATAIAEGFREQGKSVLLLVDSLTRYARALRELSLGLGEAPGRRGYPPSVFERLAAIAERAGNDARGSISAVYTVLIEGEAEEDPVTQEVKGLLDGHLVLSEELARAGCFPALDPAESLSRVMDSLISEEHRGAARKVRSWWSTYLARRELIAAGAYLPGSEPETDLAIARRPGILEFLRQASTTRSAYDTCVADLCRLAGVPGESR
jgi:type III secretion protein N (ATPase)